MKVGKLLSLLTAATIMIGALAGCSSSKQAESTNLNSGPVKLVYSRGKDTTGSSAKIIDAFNQKYQGKIEVTPIEMPSDSDKQHDQYVTVFSAGGTDYDVVDIDVIWPAEFAQAGYALPLDKYIAKDGINVKDYMEGPIKSVTFKGKVWALPKFIDAGLLFYRKDVVDSAPATWEELAAKSEQLKGKLDFSYAAQAKQYEGLICNAVEFMAAYGGQVVDGEGNIIINSDGTKKGLEMMKTILTSSYVPNNVTTFTELETHTAFLEGKVAFIRNWPYQWAMTQDEKQSKIVGKVAIAPLPQGSVKSAACLGGWSAMINKNTKHPDEAWEFLKFMNGPEGQKISAVYGGVAPTITKLYQDADVIKANPLFGDANFVHGLSAAVPRPVSPIYPKLSNIMQLEISNYLGGRQDVDTTVNKMESRMKEAVASSK